MHTYIVINIAEQTLFLTPFIYEPILTPCNVNKKTPSWYLLPSILSEKSPT